MQSCREVSEPEVCNCDCAGYLPELEDHQFGFYAGYLGSAFNLGSIFAAFFWGRLADSIGRRPVFLICIGALALGMFCFAFSPTFWSAVAIRFISGTFMGIPAVAQTYCELQYKCRDNAELPLRNDDFLLKNWPVVVEI